MKTNHEYASRFKILKNGRVALIVSTLLGSITLVSASPTDGVVTSGTATISQSANTTTINQTTNKASINWQSFSVKTNETVNFIQPSTSSVTLNRVVGVTKSLIDGTINANGQVFLLNPNGIVFSKGSSVNVGGLVASTLNMSDEDFQAGNYTLSGESTNSILNLGTLKANQNGYVVLAGKSVSNEGLIKATLGDIHLVGASKITLNINGNSLIKLTIDKGILDSLVENKGIIQANGGEIYLTTQALDTVLNGVVNNTGIIEANSIDTHNGKIVLYAHGGTTTVDGTLSAQNGFIETSGKVLGVKDTASIQTKTWLLDPTNLTIDSSGLADTVSAITVQNSLSTADVELQADQDITIDEDITWTEATKLTLTAGDEIFVNATINNTNSTTGGVYFNAANTTDKVVFDPTTGKVIVNNVFQLQWINQALAGKYELGSNIDASATSSWNSGAGFNPIGNASLQFEGTFDGKGNIISNLFINRPSTNYVGLFGYLSSGAVLQNVGLLNVNITGNSMVGGLVGRNNVSISNSYTTGSINGYRHVGGLLGYNGYSGSVVKSYSTASVTGSDAGIGGLVGSNYGTVSSSYASGKVVGASTVGGLVGYSIGTVANSYWDIDTTEQTLGVGVGDSTGTTGVYSSTPTIDAFTQATYSNLDFTNDWYMIDGETRPFLRSEYSTTISNDHQLQLMAMNLSANYTLANDITYSGDMWSSKGFNPIGKQSSQFTGNFDGLGHTISNLFIDRPTTDNVGLFGYTGISSPLSTIQNIGLINVDITGHNFVGSLVGESNGNLIKVYATGRVSGNYKIGGLVGQNEYSLIDSYSMVNVSGYDMIGGLVGSNNLIIKHCYAAGLVSATIGAGGIAGGGSNFVVQSYWDKDTTGQTIAGGGPSGTTIYSTGGTPDAFTQATYTGFDFTNDWIIYEGNTRPLLRTFMTPLTVTANDATKTYDGNVYNGANGVTYSTTPNANLLGTSSYGNDKNVGIYTITPSGLYSNQQGYIISYGSGTLTINSSPITAGINNQTINTDEIRQIKTPVKNEIAFRIDDIKPENSVVVAEISAIVNKGMKLPVGLINNEEL